MDINWNRFFSSNHYLLNYLEYYNFYQGRKGSSSQIAQEILWLADLDGTVKLSKAKLMRL